jgi:hypothetical protein
LGVRLEGWWKIGRGFTFPRCDSPGFATVASSTQRAQGMPGASTHRQPCVQNKKARKQVTAGSPERPGIPRAVGFNGFLRGLPGDRAFLPPSPADHPANLISASRYQDATTSPSAWPRVRLMRDKRPPHPAPNVRDDRETPLMRGHRTREQMPVICPTSQEKAPAADWRDGQISRSRVG